MSNWKKKIFFLTLIFEIQPLIILEIYRLKFDIQRLKYECPKSVRNCCVIDVFGGVFVLSLGFFFFLIVWDFCHGTESVSLKIKVRENNTIYFSFAVDTSIYRIWLVKSQNKFLYCQLHHRIFSLRSRSHI